MKSKRWEFDVPVETVSDRYMTMSEYLQVFHARKHSDPETARKAVLYAVQCGNPSAKLAYSKFLRTTSTQAATQTEQYRKAESTLLELLNLPDVPNKLFTAKVALELGELYTDCLRRPVGALSLYLYAKRLGATVEDRKLKELQRKMEKMDIRLLGTTGADALRLGKELHRTGGSVKLTELFLREAVDKSAAELSSGQPGAKNLYGQACLSLGDFYDDRLFTCAPHERATYRRERSKMYAEASAHGYPEYLSRK